MSGKTESPLTKTPNHNHMKTFVLNIAFSKTIEVWPSITIWCCGYLFWNAWAGTNTSDAGTDILCCTRDTCPIQLLSARNNLSSITSSSLIRAFAPGNKSKYLPFMLEIKFWNWRHSSFTITKSCLFLLRHKTTLEIWTKLSPSCLGKRVREHCQNSFVPDVVT